MSICECGKRRYLSRSEAKQAARSFRSARHSKVKVRAYYCDGGFWHLTSAPTATAVFFRTQRAERRAS